MRNILFIGLLLCFSLPKIWAQGEVDFKAIANKTEVGQYEQFTIAFRVDAKTSDFQPPSFEGFKVLSGPNTSYSSSFVNGRMSQNESYSYFLRPTGTGKFTIGPATVVVKGKKHKSNSITINVVKGTPKPQNANDPRSKAAKSSFFEVLVDKNEVYVGEPLFANYKVYFASSIDMPEVLEEPNYTNFYKENIEAEVLVHNSDYKGKTMKSASIKQTVLVPQKAGTIEPGLVSVKIPTLIPTNKVDFFGRRQNRKVDNFVERNFPVLTVKPLPQAGKPSNFTGAVGQFSFSVDVSRNEVSTDESITLKIKIKGDGNLPLFKLEEPDLPSTFEIFEPKYSENIKASPYGISGYKEYEYVLVPRYNGTYKIPALSFSYFNPKRGKYVTLNSEEQEVKVTGGREAPEAVSRGESIESVEQQDVEYLNKDILYIEPNAARWQEKSNRFWGSTSFWGLLLAIFGVELLMLIYFFVVYNRKEDPAESRLRRANKVARNQLKMAKEAAQNGEREKFFEAISSALWGYLSNKLHLPHSEISKEAIRKKLLDRNVSQSAVDDLLSLLESSEMARYAALDRGNLDEDYENAANILTEVEKQLGK